MIPYFYPAEAFGGPVTVSFSLARELVKRGHDVSVLTSDAMNSRTRIPQTHDTFEGVHVEYLRNLSLPLIRAAKLFLTPSLGTTLKQRFRDTDIIHLHEYRSYQNIVACRFAAKNKIPYVVQAHGSLLSPGHEFRKWTFDMTFGFEILNHCRKAIAVTPMEFQSYTRMGVPEDKTIVIPNGIDLKYYNSLPVRGAFRKKVGIDEHTRIILYLGRIHWIKGIDILLKACSRLVKGSGPKDFLLILAGPDDGYLAHSVSLSSSLNLKHKVIFIEGLYGNDKLEAYVDADIFVLPSRYEIWGMTALEAIACGAPVVLTSSCGIAPYLKDKVALVTKNSAEELAEALHLLLSDQNLAQEFRSNARAVVEQFEMAKVAEMAEEVYLSALGRN